MIEFVDEDNKSIRKASNVLVEKYRPLTVKNIILPPRYQKLFNKYIEEQEIQNMIIHSISPGVGKTTVAKALASDCNYEYNYINTSLYRGIDTLRHDISQYATVKAANGKRKLVILDECDYATKELQAGLRGAMEEFYNSCRFILTANHVENIIGPLKSRCNVINFDFNDNDKKAVYPKLVKRLEGIATKENISFVDGIMGKLVDVYYPDIRKMINIISEYSRQYDVIDESIFNIGKIDDELGSLILNMELKSARQFIIDRNYKYEDLYRYIFDKIIPNADDSVKGDLYKLASEYIDMATRSWDQEITFTGFLVSIMEIMGQ